MTDVVVTRPVHGHNQVAAAIFVGSLLLAAGMVISAEITKTERYEFHGTANETSYVLFDRETGRAVTAQVDSKDPTAALKN